MHGLLHVVELSSWRCPLDQDNRDFVTLLFEQVESQVQFGDGKASLLIAGDAILLAISGSTAQFVSGCSDEPFALACTKLSFALACAIGASASLILSLTCALWAARPSSVHGAPRPEFLLISYIAKLPRSAFIDAYSKASTENVSAWALEAVHSKAQFATRKFRWLKRAVDSALVGLALLALTGLVAAASKMSQVVP